MATGNRQQGNRCALSGLLFALAVSFALPAAAQSFRVQCPATTNLHPTPAAPGTNPAGGQIKCQQIAGGDGYATMGDGHQIYLFAFGPLSGMQDIANGQPGTQSASVFNAGYVVGSASVAPTDAATLTSALLTSGKVSNSAVSEPAVVMDLGVLSGSQPAPTMAIDEDDEFFLTLSNVGMIMRPDLFEQHTVHFHGYPNASSYFDGVPDASVAINIAGSFTYYYTAPDAGTYFWHCHITPPEHLQMGMVGQLFVRPRQNRVPPTAALSAALIAANKASPLGIVAGTSYNGASCLDILCTGQTPAPAVDSGAKGGLKYAYNDGDGSTRYDVEMPLQLHGFDPNFHYVGMTFNPEAFADMKDKYFLLNGRSYPDTIGGQVSGSKVISGPMTTLGSDGVSRVSQPLPSQIVINKTAGQTRALLRISDLNVTEFHTLATLGIPMQVIALNARLLRDMAGTNLYYNTNSITLGGGESIDVILDVSDPQYQSGQTFYLYTTNLDHLSNDAENFGGMMTEIAIQ
jgi:FtsP/CotA-like multicopper oxidase with cupredoxin domain